MLLRLARFFSSMLSQFLKKLVALHTSTTKSRLMELEKEQSVFEGKIAAARADLVPVNGERLKEWLLSLREGDIYDKKFQAGLFDTFLVAVYVYDDDLKIVFSFSGDKNTISVPLDASVIDNLENSAQDHVRLSSSQGHQKRKRRTLLLQE